MTLPGNPWVLMGSAFIGIVTAVGVLVWERVQESKRQQAMTQTVKKLNEQMLDMSKQLSELRKLQQKSKTRRKQTGSRKSLSVVSGSTEDFVSGTEADDVSDLEFYDCSDDEATSMLGTILEEIDSSLEKSTEDATATCERLHELCFQHPENPELLWRLGRAYHKRSDSETDPTLKLSLANRGVDACEAAVRLNPDHGPSRKWLAVLVGSRSELQPLKDRIKDGILFKEHLDVALGLLPDDPTLLYLLGRYCYEVAKLSWLEKKVAATIADELPVCTYRDALTHCLRANEVKSGWKDNELLVAKCYVALGEHGEAVRWLANADRISEPLGVDTKVDSEVKALLAKYNSYR